MRLVPVKTPKLITRIFPNYVWDFSSKDKVIYLTFDDGPTPEVTHWVLKILKQYNTKATFFCIGNNIQKHPEIFQDIIEDGHSIGNHTFDHLKGWETSKGNYIKNILKAQELIEQEWQKSKIKSQKPLITSLFRPPYGKIKSSQGKALIKLGYQIIMWSVLTFDWEQDVSKELCLKNAITKTRNGNIIVFHDSIKASKNMRYALPKFLEHFSKKGYQFKAIEI